MPGYTKTCTSDDDDADATEHNVTTKPIMKYRVYRRRWIILGLFAIYSCINLMQWIQYTIIADVIVAYYGISYAAVDWSAMIYLLLYIPFNFPGSYFVDKLGLRKAILFGMFLTCIGAWVKMASVAPERYWAILVGQSFVAIADVFILPIPPRLAAVWFGSNEVSSACSIGVFGGQLGIAAGSLLPPMLVNQGMEKQEIESKLFMMSLVIAIICSILFLILLLFFQNEPPTPPSAMEGQKNEHQPRSFMNSLKQMMWNRSFVFFSVAYGMNIGVYYAISILLNQIVLKHHPNATAETGVVGVIIIVSGMISSILGGIILDKFHKFRETSLALFVLSFAANIAFTFVINKNMELIYFVSGLIGFFMAGVLTTGLEVGVELTYPEPEGTSGGLLTSSAQIFGILFTYLYSFLLNQFNDLWANVAMSLLLCICIFIILCINFDLKRQKARGIVELCN